MAELEQITTWQDAGAYLRVLRDTIRNDIRPLLATEGGAPFAIFREVMSYIDHLGNLYSGKEPVEKRFILFLQAVSAKIDPNYATRAQEIYQMYRCGPVHEFCPKVLENAKGQKLAWLSYRGGRKNETIRFRGKPDTVRHLEPLRDSGNSFSWLPISSDCLVDDLDQAIDIFSRSPDHAERITAWNRSARRRGTPHPFNFSL